VILGGCYWLVYGVSKARVLHLGSVRVDANGERYRITNEVLNGIKDVKILGNERFYQDGFEQSSLQMTQSSSVAQLLSTLPQFVVQAIAFGGFVLLSLVLIDAEVFSGGADIGGLLPLLGVFAFSAQRLIPELQRVYAAVSRLKYGTAALDHIHDQLTHLDTLPDLPDKAPGNLGLTRALELDGISYSYPEAEQAGIRDFSLTVRCGETIGIVGSTGAGKTTLADILLGLLRPQAGSILADGQLVDDNSLRAWQRTVGYVPQTIFLSDASVSENIALGLPLALIDQAQVEKCARIAQLHDFITRDLPQGYATTVGERGVRLSGGQRQRIGIARALYHDADLIVFDEATSALDNLTEQDIMAAFQQATQDKTVIMIAHRLSTIRACDRIVVMESGRISAIGSYEELSARDGTFQRLLQASES
jgi:ABC-type multidrug transport system fused ATPase/permease subunit